MTRFLILMALLAASVPVTGCAHREKSGWKIIDEGDPNPMIKYSPARAGERVRREGEPRRT